MDDIQSGMIKAGVALLIFISAISFVFMASRNLDRLQANAGSLFYERVLYV